MKEKPKKSTIPESKQPQTDEVGSTPLPEGQTEHPVIDPESEPTARSAPFPIWLIVLLGVGLFGAQVYLDQHAGGFSAQVYEPYASLEDLDAQQPKSEGDQILIQGRRVYAATCAACHMQTGTGTPGTFPPLAGSDWVTAPGPGRIIRIVLDGLSGPIEVSGQTYNSAMVPWRDTLSDEDVAAVLTYIRQAWGNDAPPVLPDQVAAIREQTQDRIQPWTATELLQEVPVGE